MSPYLNKPLRPEAEVRAHAIAQRFDVEALRLRKYTANRGHGGNVNSEQMAQEATLDAKAIRLLLVLAYPVTEVPGQFFADLRRAAE